MFKSRALRLPDALRPRIQDLDAIVRQQRSEIEGLRASLALTSAGSGWLNEGDISLKLAKLFRVLRLRYAPPQSMLGRLARSLGVLADAMLERERDRLSARQGSVPAPASAPPSALSQLLNLGDPYLAWKREVEPLLDQKVKPAHAGLRPLISIVLPVYKVSPRILRATLDSLLRQTYSNWEACIAFADPEGAASLQLLMRYARRDRRFRVERLDQNFGISGNSNAALSLARGDYIGLLDHDDELTPQALARIVEAITATPQADFLYTDKEQLSESGARRFAPLLKPSWSPETLYSVNYLTHFNVLSAGLMAQIGGWALGVDGAQDWDLFLRATERAAHILRVPGIAYSWRVHPGSTAAGIAAKPYALDAQLRALNRHAERVQLPGRFERYPDTDYRVVWNEVAPVRVLVLGGRQVEPLLTLVSHLERERRDFTQVDLLLTPEDSWAFRKQWRQSKRSLPAWCKVNSLIAEAPIQRAAGLLTSASERVTVILDGGLMVHTPGALRQLAGWLHGDGPIAFASGVTVESDDFVVEAGSVRDEAGVAHPLFRGSGLRQWGAFGGPLWHRNVATASPYLLALRTSEAARGLAALAALDWQHAFHRLCADLTQVGERRGVVDPSARAIVAPGCAFPAPAEGLIGQGDGFFHPYLTLTPERGIALREARDYAA